MVGFGTNIYAQVLSQTRSRSNSLAIIITDVPNFVAHRERLNDPPKNTHSQTKTGLKPDTIADDMFDHPNPLAAIDEWPIRPP